MIIKIKERDASIASLSTIFVLAIIISMSIPVIYSQTVNTTTAGFGVWVVISNQNPVNLSLRNISFDFSVDPVAGTTVDVLVSFNVSDPDGLSNVNGTDGNARADVNFTLGAPSTSQFRTQSSCTNTTNPTAGMVVFNCIVKMKYYDNASSNWVINLTVTDANGATINNASFAGSVNTFTYNSLSSFSIIARDVSEGANLNFSSANIGVNDQTAKAPILLNNTGNADFDRITLTGATLLQVGGAGTIDIGQFAVNTTNNTGGRGLPLTTAAQTIRGVDDNTANATLLHGPGKSGDTVPYNGVADFKSKGNQSLIFFVDIPAGTATGSYNNTWNITVTDLP
ncbi:hypothetical protein HYU09_02460 [Candidatus Woesearchaeota archaeon]|nr:hypothetical protein [Candidatus Woesearchaeota archaeon]